jgi:alpha-glucosidase
MMKLRRALQPFLHDLLWRHHAEYQPVSRPLWLDFPGDPAAWEDGDAHLLGPDVLVAPAMDPGVATVTTYLPAGAVWRDLRDDRAYAGGQSVTLAAPLAGLPPMLAREGSGVFLDLAPAGFNRPSPSPACCSMRRRAMARSIGPALTRPTPVGPIWTTRPCGA